MAEVASAYVSLLPSLRGFGSRLSREAGPQLDRAGAEGGKRLGAGMSKSFAGSTKRMFAPIVAGIAAVGVGSFFKDAIQGASDLNEAGTKVEAIFGKSGKAMVDAYAGKGAKALGQTQLDVLNAASAFGTFGKAAGKGGKDLAKFSTGFAGLSTDLASFYNTSPEDAVQAIGAALRGEAEPIRKYGVLLDDATLRQEALKQGLIKTTKQALTPQQKILAAQAQIWKQTSDAQGDFKKTSGGLANQSRILGAQFKDLRSKIGQQLLPVAVKFATFLNDKFIPGAVNLGKKLAPSLSRVGDVLKSAATGVKAFVDGFRNGPDTKQASDGLGRIATAGAKVGDFLSAAGDKAVAFGGWLKNNLWPALKDGYKTILPGLQQAFKILTGGSGLGGGGTALRSIGDIITKVVIPAVAKFVQVSLPLLATHIRVCIETTKLFWKAFQQLGVIVGGVISFVLKRFADVADGFGAFLAALGHVPGFGWATDAAKKLQNAADKARNLADAIDDLDGKEATIRLNMAPVQGRLKVGNELVNLGMRAKGGPVRAGQPYIVGEKRPELFVPNRSGTIIPQVPEGGGRSGAGVVQNFNGPIMPHDYSDFERQMEQKRRREASRVL